MRRKEDEKSEKARLEKRREEDERWSGQCCSEASPTRAKGKSRGGGRQLLGVQVPVSSGPRQSPVVGPVWVWQGGAVRSSAAGRQTSDRQAEIIIPQRQRKSSSVKARNKG